MIRLLRMRSPASLILAVAITAGVSPAQKPAPKSLLVPFDIVIPVSPTVFKADDKWHIAYELHIATLGGKDCTISSIEAVSGDSSAHPFARFSDSSLRSIVTHPGQKPSDPTKLAGGSFAVVYMWATFDSPTEIPATMRQRVMVKVGDYPEAIALETAPTPINHTPVVVINPPLRGDNWVAGNGPSNTSAHRRAFIAIDGHGYISQRFAIDWVQLNPDGKTYHGDSANNKNYRAFGNEIHSVAAGVVTETRDSIPENIPGAESRAVPITLETVGGNHVIVKIADGVYAFYAHMQPGSLRVKVGDHVVPGQVLGLVGNTGNSTEPHLHFDICDQSSMLGCEGLPYAFPSFELQGQGEGWVPANAHASPVRRVMEIPAENDVVRFPAS